MSNLINGHKTVLRRLTIAQTLQFHKETVDRTKDESAKVNPLTDVKQEYETDVQNLETAYNENIKSIETEEMVEKDTDRDAVTEQIITRVDFAYNHPADSSEESNARLLQFEVDKYKKALKQDYKAQTAATRKFIVDLRTHTAAITMFSLTTLIDRLEIDNNTFEQLYASRSDALEAKRQRGRLGILANKVNESFDYFCIAIAGLAVAKPAAGIKASLDLLITNINTQIHDYTVIYHRHAGVLAKHRKGKDKDNDKDKNDDNKTDSGTQTPDTPPSENPPAENPPAENPPTNPQPPDTSNPGPDPGDPVGE